MVSKDSLAGKMRSPSTSSFEQFLLDKKLGQAEIVQRFCDFALCSYCSIVEQIWLPSFSLCPHYVCLKRWPVKERKILLTLSIQKRWASKGFLKSANRKSANSWLFPLSQVSTFLRCTSLRVANPQISTKYCTTPSQKSPNSYLLKAIYAIFKNMFYCGSLKSVKKWLRKSTRYKSQKDWVRKSQIH
jgi:hypothetical protein